MVYIEKETIEKLNSININDLYVVIDFDRTITSHNSCSTFGVFSNKNFVSNDYSIKSKELFDYYYPKEKDVNLDLETKKNLMIEWWNTAIDILINSKLEEEKVRKAINKEIMEFRNEGQEFLKTMSDKKIPVIIISAGIGDFIEQFLELNNCLFDNIYIFSNYLKFENGYLTGIYGDVIHSQNKDIVMLNNEALDIIKDKKNILLFGDGIADVKMASNDKREETIRVGFLDSVTDENLEAFKNEFDIVCTEETSFNKVLSYIKL